MRRTIIATFAEMEEAEARAHQPAVVLVDEQNRIKDAGAAEIAGPQRRMTV